MGSKKFGYERLRVISRPSRSKAQLVLGTASDGRPVPAADAQRVIRPMLPKLEEEDAQG
jgi:hypothetical protein